MMNLEDLKDPWDDLGQDIEDNWQLDLNLLRQSYLDKASDKLKNLFRVKLLVLYFFLAVTAYLLVIIVKNQSSNETVATLTFFEFWTVTVSLVLLYELFLLKRIDYNEHLAILLKKLSQIKLSTIRLLRLGAILLPLNTLLLGYYIATGQNLIEHIVTTGIDWVVVCSLIFCVLVSYWLLQKISLKNVEKKWMYQLLRGNGSQVLDAIYFMKQISSLEQDDLPFKEARP